MDLGLSSIVIVEGILKNDLKQELKMQGHYLTGGLENSVVSDVLNNGNNVAVEVFADGYIDPVNDGVPAHKIPYDPDNRSGAKSSKYIEGLKNYAKLRFGLTDDKAALGAAFAIAKKHKKEGMPTQGSYSFSKNGSRTEAIESVINANEKKIGNIIEKGVNADLDDLLGKGFDVKI